MIDDDINKWEQEVQKAEDFIQKRTQEVQALVNQYHGIGYNADRGSADAENVAFSWISWMMGQVVHSNPRVRLRSRGGLAMEDDVEAHEHALNRWIRDTEFAKNFRPAAMDSLFGHGIVHVTMEKNPLLERAQIPEAIRARMSSENARPEIPVMHQVPMGDWFVDPGAFAHWNKEFEGHKEMWSLKRLKSHAETNSGDGWLMDAIESLVPQTDARGLTEIGRETGHRDEVMLYQIWVPNEVAEDVPWNPEEEPTPEFGYHGTLLTMARRTSRGGGDDATGVWVRKPVPFYGPMWGPYSLIGNHTVPGEIVPMGGLQAVKQQIDDLNTAEKAISKSAGEYKKFIAFDRQDKKTADAIRTAWDGHFLGLPAFDPKNPPIAQFEVGGITDQQIAHYQGRKDLLGEVLGFTDAQKGQASRSTTATASVVADSNADIRTSQIQQSIQSGALNVLRTVSWYLNDNADVVFPYGEDDPESGGKAYYMYYGGPNIDTGENTPWSDLELEIELYSMERTDPNVEQARMLQMNQLLIGMLPAMVQYDFVPWREWMMQIADLTNQSGVVEKFDWAGLRNQQTMFMQGQQMSMLTGQPGGDARLSGMQPTLGPKFTQQGMGQSAGAGAAQGAMGGV